METYYNFLASGEYLRFLLAMIVAGTVTSAKRTAVAMHFGRRTFSKFLLATALRGLTKKSVPCCAV